eukprot:6045522-Lingulodinium_polyedra.AAC.1
MHCNVHEPQSNILHGVATRPHAVAALCGTSHCNGMWSMARHGMARLGLVMADKHGCALHCAVP